MSITDVKSPELKTWRCLVGNEQTQAITLCTCNWKRSNPTARPTCADHDEDCKPALLNHSRL